MPSLLELKRRITNLNIDIKDIKKQIVEDMKMDNIFDIEKLNQISTNITSISIDVYIKTLQDGINTIENFEKLLRKESTRRIYQSKIKAMERKNIIINKTKIRRMEVEERKYLKNENPYVASSSSQEISE